ncbi:DUF4142 domain-containing protein [Novosphingobium sp.]|uniref:DUF4142 domain-containing protein n=1 Tax=Novosphingobium sp. TaxID=1874826 RepID=UPI0031D989AC
MNKSLIRFTLPAILPALALAACQKAPSTADAVSSGVVLDNPAAVSSSDSGSDTAPVTDAKTYLEKAGAGDKFEIDSSRAILKTTKNAEIENFAKMMISAHTESTEKVKKAAMAADIKAPAPVLPPELQQKLDAIKAAKGEDADKLYLEAQKEGHQAALALHKSYGAGGDTPQLKVVADNIVPVVRDHITMLNKMTS